MELVAVCSDDHVDALGGPVNKGLWSIPRHQHGMNPVKRKNYVKSHFLKRCLMPTETRV